MTNYTDSLIDDWTDEEDDEIFDGTFFDYLPGFNARRCDYCNKLFPIFDNAKYYACLKPECQEKEEKDKGKHREYARIEREALLEAKREEEEKVMRAYAVDISEDFGYVYLLRSENGLYKIGRSKIVEARRNSLERAIPIKIEILHCIQSGHYKEAELYLHDKFKDFRIRYEWFKLLPEHVSWIKNLQDGDIDELML